MEIKELREIRLLRVQTDERDYNSYRRVGKNAWERLIGELWVTLEPEDSMDMERALRRHKRRRK